MAENLVGLLQLRLSEQYEGKVQTTSRRVEGPNEHGVLAITLPVTVFAEL